MTAPEFWENGLRFACARCSACCRLVPGYVFLSADDITRLCRFMGLAFRTFMDKFTRPVDMGDGWSISLKERRNHDCVLWAPAGCIAYDARPVQCSTYPFWSGILSSEESWRREALDCPGIGAAVTVPAEAIKERLWLRRANPPLLIAYDARWETIDEDTILGRARIHTDSPDAGEAEEQDFLDSPADIP